MTMKFDVGGILSGYTRVYLRMAVILLIHDCAWGLGNVYASSHIL